jgi:ribosomal protein L37AE/L43A
LFARGIQMAWRFARIRELVCAHHTDVRRVGNGRLWLECTDCGRATAGVLVTPAAVARASREPQRLRSVVSQPAR